MFGAFLITFREVIEASLIVATILGILARENQRQGTRVVWHATVAAGCVSIALIFFGGLLGTHVRDFYAGEVKEKVEGVLMLITAFFITWAVVFLHNFFAKHRTRLVLRIQETLQKNELRSLFGLVFFAVLREGIEVILFLSGLIISSPTASIAWGALGGIIVALCVAFIFFIGVERLPAVFAVQGANVLLVLFAGWLLYGGVRELLETVFLSAFFAVVYTGVMIHFIFFRNAKLSQ